MELAQSDTTKHLSDSHIRVVKRRRLGRSLGGKNTGWTPPFATPPSGRNSGDQASTIPIEGECTSSGSRLLSEISPTTNETGSNSTPVIKRCSVSTVTNKSCSLSGASNSTPTVRLGQQRKFRSVSARKRFGDFKSPLRKSEERQAEETPASVQRDNETLQARLSELDEEIISLQNEGCKEEELQLHIKKMHEYNELKDMAQMLLGRIASLEGVTTRQLHEEMGIHDGD
ncbi:uncharacterized protein [Diadema antillarum]|uniref:uncharacterized protein n=1 Tax=Diadema antillarum TaxID=105358 RepID=UPI003A84702F